MLATAGDADEGNYYCSESLGETVSVSMRFIPVGGGGGGECLLAR